MLLRKARMLTLLLHYILQPRYIEGLLKKAKERERTQEMVMERKIQKEQAAEAHLYGDKEKFVTGAYKRKLAEDAKWREEERRREELEAVHDVSLRTVCFDSDFLPSLWIILSAFDQLSQEMGKSAGGITRGKRIESLRDSHPFLFLLPLSPALRWASKLPAFQSLRTCTREKAATMVACRMRCSSFPSSAFSFCLLCKTLIGTLWVFEDTQERREVGNKGRHQCCLADGSLLSFFCVPS